jgi:mannose-6-phosphate isomerase
VAKPWGYEIWYALTDRYAGKILHVACGYRLSLQYHERKDESCYVLGGRLLLLQGTDPTQLAERVITAGSIWRNQPGVIHTTEALEDSERARGLDPRSRRRCAPARPLRTRRNHPALIGRSDATRRQ